VVLVLGALVAFGSAGCTCKKAKQEEAKKDDKPSKKTPLVDVAAPDTLLAELDLKDPDAFAKRAADGAGFGKEVGASPYEKLIGEAKDENAKKALKAIDPHGALVVVALGDVAKAIKDEKADDNFHAIGAARLKDAELATTALGAAAKAGKFKTKESKALETTLYLPDGSSKKGVIAIIGDQIVVADTTEVIESAGKYVAARAAKVEKQEHDLEGRVVTERLSKPSVKFLDTLWSKYKTEIPGKAQVEADKVVQGLLAGFGDTGDVTFTADVKGDDVLVVQKVAAKGSFSKWLTKFPAVDPKALLSMPKGQGVAAFAAPEGLGPLMYEGLDEGMKSGKLPPADAADISKNVRALGGALGQQVAYTTATHGTGGGAFASPETEIFARVDLTDAAAAKAALAGLSASAKKPFAGIKGKSVAYKKGGGEGETWTIEEGAKPSTFVYAIKGTYLYLDVCISCVPTVFDGALEGKDLLETDGTAKAKIASYPSKGLVSASYGDADSYGKLLSSILGPSSGPAPTGSTWGYVTVSADALEGRSGVPLSVVGGIVRAVMMGGMRGRGLGGAGLAPPPPGMDE
jgi:hypothetical protein